MPSRLMLVVIACAFFAGRAHAAVTADDCGRWIDQLGGEVSRANISGDKAEDSRNAIMHEVDAARQTVDESKDKSLERVKRAQRQTANLVARGQISGFEAQRLTTLVEAARRCLEHMNGQ